MNQSEQNYLNLLQDILDNGEDRMDRTKVGTRAVFGRSLRFNLQDGFPLLTTRKMSMKAILGEMLWFVEGSGDERRLCEITYGTRDPSRTTIWTANAQASYWEPKAKFQGDLGRVYGVQWRQWKSPVEQSDGTWQVKTVDQLANIINSIKTNPTDRRMILTAFNPGELDQMALPPCHMMAQFFVDITHKKLSCQMYMRSIDSVLGLSYNIASYAFLTHMIAKVTNLSVGELTILMGDTHIYSNHIEGIQEQLNREPYTFPILHINNNCTDINSFNMEDFDLVGYKSHESIKFDMAV